MCLCMCSVFFLMVPWVDLVILTHFLTTFYVLYGKCSKISNTFHFLFSTKMLVIRAGIYKMIVRIANREDPDQTASSEAV